MIYKDLKNILVGYLFTLLIIEILSRILFSFLSFSFLPFVYGFNSQIKLSYQNGRRSKPIFLNFQPDFGKKTINKKDKFNNLQTINIATGGSTTYGKFCSKSSSSWPDQLEILSGNKIYNHAKNGSNSDYALRNIDYFIKKKNPQKVYFANWINERDIMTYGPKKNRDILIKKYSKVIEEIDNKNNNNYFISKFSSLDLTLKKYSLFYVGLNNTIEKLFSEIKNNENNTRNLFSIDYQKMSIENYFINLKSILQKSKKYKFELVVVRPPIDWITYSKSKTEEEINEIKNWDKMMIDKVLSYQKDKKFNFIVVQYLQNSKNSRLFCDGVHQRYDGHKKTADIIFKSSK